MLVSKCPLNHILFEPRISRGGFRWKASASNEVPVEKWKQDSIFIDRRGRFRQFDHKKVSRKRCGSLRGRGWKYGSGFVDGIFPVLSPIAQQILTFIKTEKDPERIWSSLDTLRPTNNTWDDLINVAVQLRLNKQWDLIILMCEWILCRSSFQADVICYNLLIEAYGQSSLVKKAESTYLALVDARCVPTEDTYALLLKSYSKCRMIEKAEAVFSEMRKNGLPSSMFSCFLFPVIHTIESNGIIIAMLC